ncbi:conserved hypothetical protein [Anaeromyxobacter sp. K]|uniref:hypothetical protein n=1 Tax=Anaeromyxobacter sp. (strain K) TaxID=447217 RepID=UPI00015F8D70|nr:hypothetical protein [Anaeromyxobacter sp. K]ACG75332.1 conserved hypothetical protein [Anaeromyxobacter sp. K]
MAAPAPLLALALALAAGGGPGGAPPVPVAPPRQGTLDARREAIAQELLRIGGALQREIEAGDVGAVLARVPAEGLRCAGQVVPRARVERDLREPSRWLHQTLFGAPEGAGGGAPASLRALLVRAKEVAVMVSFRRDPRAGPVGRPCLEFRARDLVNPAPPFCFEKQGRRWWLTESLYPCG